ncbi:MAG TPA: hypothetical protein VL282_09245 [Tepidisphaeraceae bacterium]|nr:hypothetical protein [Tepidisphaeraceae bacterium]
MNAEDESFLRSEFNAEEGSFLLQLRCEARWDETRFRKPIEAMERCAEAYAGNEFVPRWLAEGFWYLDTFVPDQVKLPAFARQHDGEFFRERCEDLACATYWFFTGEAARR